MYEASDWVSDDIEELLLTFLRGGHGQNLYLLEAHTQIFTDYMI